MTTMYPEGRVGPGVRRFAMPQGESLIGREVVIRDWYGDVHATVTGTHEDLRGFLGSLDITLPNGRKTTMSLNATREIEVCISQEVAA